LPHFTDYPVYLFNQLFLVIFLVISGAVLLLSRDFLVSKQISQFEYDILFSFVLLSSICLCFADDFLIIYLAIELQSLCFYVFATFNRNSEFSTESGLKYFIFGAVISVFLLLGFALVYLSFGTTSFEHLFCLINSNDVSAFFFSGVFFILSAFLFKVGAAPFHS
jgi:NADH-quinone oxidoreductase subunit N